MLCSSKKVYFSTILQSSHYTMPNFKKIKDLLKIAFMGLIAYVSSKYFNINLANLFGKNFNSEIQSTEQNLNKLKKNSFFSIPFTEKCGILSKVIFFNLYEKFLAKLCNSYSSLISSFFIK